MTHTDNSGPAFSDSSEQSERDSGKATLRETIETEILSTAIARVHAQRQTEATHTLRIGNTDHEPATTAFPEQRSLKKNTLPLCVHAAGKLAWILLGAGGLFAVTSWMQPHLLNVPDDYRHWVGAGGLLAGAVGWAALGTVAAIYRRLD